VDDLTTGTHTRPALYVGTTASVHIVWEYDTATAGYIYYARNVNTPPEPPTHLSPASGNWTNSSSPTLRWQFNDNDTDDFQSAFRVLIDRFPDFLHPYYDSGVVESQAENFTLPVSLPEGTWYWKVDTRDSSGAWSGFNSSWVLRVDITAPGAETPTDSGEYSTSTALTWQWNASQDSLSGVKGYHVCIGTSQSTCDVYTGFTTDTSYTYTGASDGTTYYMRIRAEDNAGNVGQYSAPSDGITVDTVPPVTPAISDSGNYTNTSYITWTWPSGSDSVSGIKGYYIYVGTSPGLSNVINGAFVTGNSYTFINGMDGVTYYARLVAQDNAGNLGSMSPSTDGITVDFTAPAANTPVDQGDFTSNTSIVFSWAPSSDRSGIAGYQLCIGTAPGGCDVVSSAFTANTSYTLVQAVHGSTYYAKVRAVDYAGNVGQYSTPSDGITVDTTPPASLSIYPFSNVSSSTSFYITWSESWDSESGVMWYAYALGTTPGGTDIYPWTHTTATFTTVSVPDQEGTYYFTVRAVNRANLTGPSDGAVIILDTTPPGAPVVSYPGEYIGTQYLTWNWTCQDSTGIGYYMVAVYMDGTPVLRTSVDDEEFVYRAAPGHMYHITVRAVDLAGNAGNATATPDSLVDVQAPVMGAVHGSRYTSNLTLTWWWTEPEDPSGIDHYTVTLYVNGTPAVSVDVQTSSFSCEGVHGATYTITVCPADRAGNTGPCVDSAPALVDTTPPVAGGSAGSIYTQASGSITWEAFTDPESGIDRYEYCIGTSPAGCDVVDWDTTTVPAAHYTALGEGTYHLIVMGYNGAGLSAQLDITFTVDTTPPDAVVVYGEDYCSTTRLHWWWAAPEDAGAIAGYYVSLGYTPYGTDLMEDVFVTSPELIFEGAEHARTYYITVRAADAAGNVGEAGTHQTYVDLRAPAVLSVSGSEHAHSESITWSWQAVDDGSGISEYQVWITGGTFNRTYTVTASSIEVSQGLVEGVTYRIYVRAVDMAGNAGPWYSGPATELDTMAPSGELDAPELTSSRYIELRINTADADITSMMLSEDRNFTGAVWEPFQPARVWTLSGGDGAKNIYLKLRDAGGLESAVITAVVVLDTAPPDVELSIPDTAASDTLIVKGTTEPGASVYVNGRAVPVDSDGAFSIRLGVSGGGTTVSVRVADSAGNTVTLTRYVPRSSGDPGAFLLMLAVLLLLVCIGLLVYAGRKLRSPAAPAGTEAHAEEREEEAEEAAEEEEGAGEPDEDEIVLEEEPVTKVKCPACGGIVPVYTTKRPTIVECPSCGKKGVIK